MRGIELLTKETQGLANKLVSACAAHGLAIKITDTLRTKEEQDELYAQGRTKPGSIVTNVKYPNSMHNWGVAFDFCRNDGTGAYNEAGNFFAKVGAIGRNIGLEWGGDWTSIVDRTHFQLPQYGSTPSRLISQYGTPENFLGNVSRETSWPTLKSGSRNEYVKLLQSFLGLVYGHFEVEVDSIYGERTKAAVRAFQGEMGLDVDGIVGPKTWDAIRGYING